MISTSPYTSAADVRAERDALFSRLKKSKSGEVDRNLARSFFIDSFEKGAIVGLDKYGGNAAKSVYFSRDQTRGDLDKVYSSTSSYKNSHPLEASMHVVKARDIEEAVRLAEESKKSGEHDWFRGQTKNWPVRSSYVRLDESAQQAAKSKLSRYEAWVKSTPGLEHLASDADSALAVAQHYGLPTNFVDFTTEPRTAGFFASQTPDASGGMGCIICLNTEDLKRFWVGLPSRFRPPEFLRLRVPDLWRLEAQHGCFLFCPYSDIEQLYDFDRILFPNTRPLAGVKHEEVYPARKSNLEVLLDQYFMNERLIEGTRALYGLGIPSVQLDSSTQGFIPDVFPQGLPEHFSWAAGKLKPWLTSPGESFSAVKSPLQANLTINAAGGLLSAADQVRKILLRDLMVLPHVRNRLIEWNVNLSGPSDLPPEFPARLAERLARLWDGLRYLPYSNEDVAAGLGMCVAFAVALRGVFHNPEALHWEIAANHCLGDAVEIEFGAEDGSYSRGFASGRTLLSAVRSDIRKYISARYSQEILNNPRGILQTAWDPRKAFDFTKLAPIFAREIAPIQVLSRETAIFYSPARLCSLGLP